MRFVCISDTHSQGKNIVVPDGDVLLHAGDHTWRGTEKEVRRALEWLQSLPHKHKIFIAGNHDLYFDPKIPNGHRFRNWKIYRYYRPRELLQKYPGLIYLQDSSIEIEGWKIYGSPWQPWFHDWAFNFPIRDSLTPAMEVWRKIPVDTEILLTHTPPAGVLDEAFYSFDDNRRGDRVLRARLNHLESLRLHIFGHIHEQYGRLDYETGEGNQLTFVNAAICTREYRPTNAPIVVDLEK